MHKKLQSKFLKLVIILGLLYLEGPFFISAHAQFESLPSNPTTNPEVKEGSETPQEDHNSEDLEKLLKKYNKDSEKIIEDTSKLHTITEGEAVDEAEIDQMKASKLTSEEEARRAGKSKLAGRTPLPADLSASVRIALEPLQKLSEAELLKRFMEGAKDSELRPYLEEFPNITLYIIRLIKDKESIPSLVKIVEDKKRMINFVAVMLCTILFGIFLKRLMQRDGRTFIEAVFYFFLRTAILWGLRIYVIDSFFHEELAPAIAVFKITFL